MWYTENHEILVGRLGFLFTLLTVSMAWISSYRIDNKINRCLVFIFGLGFYSMAIRFVFLISDSEAVMSGDDIVMFIYKSTSKMFFDEVIGFLVLILSFLALMLLVVRFFIELIKNFKHEKI